MPDYYTPDPIWLTDLKIENQDDYVKKYVIKGNFHSGVHEDVINSFKTVEYLMAHAYYHWQMYDQVLAKLLSIFEMAVKLRSKELDNPLQYQDRSDETKDKELWRLIKELKNFGYPGFVIRDLHWLRKLRNQESHPDGHHFAGAIKKVAIMPGINIINRLFLDPNKLTLQINNDTQMRRDKNIFSNNVFIHSYDGKKILVHGLEFLQNIELESTNCEYWKANPILTDTYESFSRGSFGSPFRFFLTNVRIENGNLLATDFHSNEFVTLYKATDERSLQAYQKHVEELERLEPIQKSAAESSYRHHLNSHLEEFVYINCWTSEQEIIPDSINE
ncbi:hypothetical protein [Fluviicola sp.]|uniref:hypothetical protein n=1 Tax=Fluviicola sp. TaxID=1917219 RepID=UPI0031E3C2D4